ncbi:hypothetical protein DLD99_10840 [Pseudomonas kribbensis]|uniref:CDI immunity protein domain-containing protein n=1 Tax=Pseudomonas kribbensis TaxID=1628086 RepID=A0A345RNS9_9PSED|nr:hypothetical protein [Pseudomonas kribbensis]AXI60945.1 hypothetical protein DLD99_10840 [Pseudomonas kribbensis]
MTMNTLTTGQKSIIHNCLLDLLNSSSLNNSSFLPKALESLLQSQGFGIEMSGIYISSDDDLDNTPEYLEDGIAFEFMESHVSLPFHEAVECIIEWCQTQKLTENMHIGATLKALQDKYK